jgi:hypothetical protein
MIAQKREVMLIDNLVLDTHEYGDMHPGGKFVITKNIGRDISKFFYGGYSMVNGPGAERPHQHSFNALKIAQAMIIGIVEGQQTCSETVLTTVVDKKAVNAKDFSFCFQTMDSKPVENFRDWHSGLEMIGKHYLVCSVEHPNVKRHYTICNTLIPEFYSEITRVTDAAINGGKPDFN